MRLTAVAFTDVNLLLCLWRAASLEVNYMLRAYACGGVYFLETWKRRGIIHEAKGMQAVTVTEGGRSATSSFQKPPYYSLSCAFNGSFQQPSFVHGRLRCS